MAKPPLFHGSPATITKFIPRDGFDAGRVPYFGTMATDSKPLATLFALKLKEGFDPVTGHGALGGVKDAIGNDAKETWPPIFSAIPSFRFLEIAGLI